MDGVIAWVAPCQQARDEYEFELVVLLGQFLVPVVHLLVQLPQGSARSRSAQRRHRASHGP